MGEWKECKLGSTGKVITGKTPSKENPEDWGNKTLFITPSDYGNYNKCAWDSIRKLSQIGTERQSARLLPSKSILVTCIGSDMGKTVINYSPCVTNQQINAIIPYHEIVDTDFLYYETVFLYDVLHSMGSDGTAVPILNKTDFENIDILLPPLPEQKAIAAVLSSLDDKIDLLHRQNKTLEAMAETLFRQWFVEEADEGWEEVPLKEICVIFNGYAFQSPTYTESGQKIIRTLNFKNHWIELNGLVYISEEFAREFDRFFLRRNDFLLVMVGASLGNFAIVTQDILPALQNQNMWRFRAIAGFSQHYLNYGLRRIIDETLHGASGSAREFFQKGVFYELKIPSPPQELLDKFETEVKSLFSRIELNRYQIRTLESLRDTLLPKLMSGEVRVKV
jgi:type I restriction enzyme, S subunit